MSDETPDTEEPLAGSDDPTQEVADATAILGEQATAPTPDPNQISAGSGGGCYGGDRLVSGAHRRR